jgi:hypothetical protein
LILAGLEPTRFDRANMTLEKEQQQRLHHPTEGKNIYN